MKLLRTTLSCAILLSAACGDKPVNSRPDIVARVGDQILTSDDFQTAMLQRGVTNNATSKRALLDELVLDMRMLQAARAQGLENDPEVVTAHRFMLISKYKEKVGLLPSDTQGPITQAALQDYYNRHPEEFQIPARIRAAMIHIPWPGGHKDETVGSKLRAQMEAARTEALATVATIPHFGPVAASYSADQATRYIGGDLGYIVEGQTDPNWSGHVNDALFSLNAPGDISEIIESSLGFFLFKLLEKSPPTQRSFHDAAPLIRSKLLSQSQEDTKKKIEISLAAIPAQVRADILDQIGTDSSSIAKTGKAASKPPPSPF